MIREPLLGLGSLLNALEVDEEDCGGPDLGQRGGPTRFFNQTFDYSFEVESNDASVTTFEQNLLSNLLTSTYNLYSQVNCDGDFIELDDSNLAPLQPDARLTVNLGGNTNGRCGGCAADRKLGEDINNNGDWRRRRLQEDQDDNVGEPLQGVEPASPLNDGFPRSPARPRHEPLPDSISLNACLCSSIRGLRVFLNDALNETIQTEIDFLDLVNIDAFNNVVFGGPVGGLDGSTTPGGGGGGGGGGRTPLPP